MLCGELSILSGKASLAYLLDLLSAHPPTIGEVTPYVRFSESGYVRTTISENSFFRLLVLCWQPGQISPIHDHAGSTCAVMIMSGTATETRYDLTAEGLARPTGTSVYGPGTIFGGQDGDVHALGNCQDDGNGLISLHIYSPPLVHMNLYTAETPTVAHAVGGKR